MELGILVDFKDFIWGRRNLFIIVGSERKSFRLGAFSLDI